MTDSAHDYLFKLLILGASGVGKSAFMRRFVDHTFDPSYVSTIGVDFSIRTVQVGDKTCKLQIWDTAGQERFKSIVASYYRGADGCIVMYDVLDHESFVEARIWLAELIKATKPDVGVILVGTKADLLSPTHTRAVSQDEVGEFLRAADLDMHFEVSAKTGQGVDKAMLRLTEKMIEGYHARHPFSESPIRKPQVKPSTKLDVPRDDGKNCCAS